MPNGNGNFDDIHEILRKIADRQDRQDAILARHAEILAEHDERMDRVGRHLEVLATICDDLIRHKADRKKR